MITVKDGYPFGEQVPFSKRVVKIGRPFGKIVTLEIDNDRKKDQINHDIPFIDEEITENTPELNKENIPEIPKYVLNEDDGVFTYKRDENDNPIAIFKVRAMDLDVADRWLEVSREELDESVKRYLSTHEVDWIPMKSKKENIQIEERSESIEDLEEKLIRVMIERISILQNNYRHESSVRCIIESIKNDDFWKQFSINYLHKYKTELFNCNTEKELYQFFRRWQTIIKKHPLTKKNIMKKLWLIYFIYGV